MALQKVNYESQTDSYWVNLTLTELKYISAFIRRTRLGHGNIFKQAAMDIGTGIDDALGEQFGDDATEEVGFYVTLEDEHGNVAAAIPSIESTFEVSGGFGQPLLANSPSTP